MQEGLHRCTVFAFRKWCKSESGAAGQDANGATAAAAAELAEAIAAEGEYLNDSLGAAVVPESARPRGSVAIARESTAVLLPSGGSAAIDVLVAAPAAAVAPGVTLPALCVCLSAYGSTRKVQ